MKDAIAFLKELGRYVWVRRQWAVGMFIIFLLLLGILVTMAGNPALAPFVYPMI